jgi:hypothetical protein
MSLLKITFTKSEIRQIVKNERVLRPKAGILDYYKLLNQACYGPTHILPDPERIAANIKAELENLTDDGQSPLQDIGLGRGFCRIYLNALICGDSGHDLARRIKALSAAIMESRLSGGIDQDAWNNIWKESLPLVLEYTDHQTDEIEIIDHCLRSGSMPGHSEVYRQAYAPHYRVVYHSLIPALRAASINI